MSLDNFKSDGSTNGSTVNTEEEAIKAAKRMRAVVLEKRLEEADTLEEKIQAIEKGWPTKQEWDNNRKGVGISTAHESLRKNCNTSTSIIYCKAGAHPGQTQGQNTIDYEFKLKSDMFLLASIYGEEFTHRTFNNHLLTSSGKMIKKQLGYTFNEFKDELGLDVSQYQNSDREKVKEQLEELVEEKGVPIHIEDIDNSDTCDFSSSLIRKRFGGGDYTDGLEELGIEVTEEQRKISEDRRDKTSNRAKVEDMLENCDKYKEEADGYIYMLNFKSEKYGSFKYIGKSGFDMSIKERLVKHIIAGGQTSQRVMLNGEIVDTSEIDFNIELQNIKNCYKKEDETVDEFKDRLEALEDRKYKESVKNLDCSMDRVLGGK